MTSNMVENSDKSDPITINTKGKFYVNPVISCRVEDDEGALLFNPDIDATILINTSGLMIWRFMNEPRTIEDMILYIRDVTSESPEYSAVNADIIQFISDLSPDYIQEVCEGV